MDVNTDAKAKVAIIMGSDSDLPVLKGAIDFLEEWQIGYRVHISSAHRVPEKTAALAKSAEQDGIEVIIAAAGGAAHLAGVIAALTALPVIGVPIKTDSLGGLDSLYSMVQMPSGIPVATVAINGAKNAAILAMQIIGIKDAAVRAKVHQFKAQMAQQVEAKDSKLQSMGAKAYLNKKTGV
ncbi:MAG: 5-(carboxyamino)imidazole ribonucleotide mutase [Bacillota bacterium]|jgi:5-(carboxyamino)imidazole ribonucleotide mutase